MIVALHLRSSNLKMCKHPLIHEGVGGVADQRIPVLTYICVLKYSLV